VVGRVRSVTAVVGPVLNFIVSTDERDVLVVDIRWSTGREWIIAEAEGSALRCKVQTVRGSCIMKSANLSSWGICAIPHVERSRIINDAGSSSAGRGVAIDGNCLEVLGGGRTKSEN